MKHKTKKIISPLNLHIILLVITILFSISFGRGLEINEVEVKPTQNPFSVYYDNIFKQPAFAAFFNSTKELREHLENPVWTSSMRNKERQETHMEDWQLEYDSMIKEYKDKFNSGPLSIFTRTEKPSNSAQKEQNDWYANNQRREQDEKARRERERIQQQTEEETEFHEKEIIRKSENQKSNLTVLVVAIISGVFISIVCFIIVIVVCRKSNSDRGQVYQQEGAIGARTNNPVSVQSLTSDSNRSHRGLSSDLDNLQSHYDVDSDPPPPYPYGQNQFLSQTQQQSGFIIPSAPPETDFDGRNVRDSKH